MIILNIILFVIYTFCVIHNIHVTYKTEQKLDILTNIFIPFPLMFICVYMLIFNILV